MGVDLDKFDKKTSLSDIEALGIQIRNISATVDIDGEFAREPLAEDLPNSEYKPGKHRSLVYRSSAVDGLVMLLPPSGRTSVAGAKTREDIITGIREFTSSLSDIGLNRTYSDIQVENIVATANLDYTLDLNTLTIALGLESTEYEPEQFPGLIYRPEDGSVILLYSTGSVVITATQTYDEILTAYQNLESEIGSIVDIYE